MIDILKKNFNQRNDISNEYFEGNCNKMIDLIKNYNNKTHSFVVSPVTDTLNKSSNIAFMKINNSLLNIPSLHKTPILAPITSINDHSSPFLTPIASINKHL
tara:strand:- start:95 stop:400 length:306 start_codon:yes stop_codon:yes gene_type:complete